MSVLVISRPSGKFMVVHVIHVNSCQSCQFMSFMSIYVIHVNSCHLCQFMPFHETQANSCQLMSIHVNSCQFVSIYVIHVNSCHSTFSENLVRGVRGGIVMEVKHFILGLQQQLCCQAEGKKSTHRPHTLLSLDKSWKTKVC
jgi:hypothetical protein